MTAVVETTATADVVGQRALSKAAWRFLPILTIAYVLNYLDRTSVGFAALTMNRDIGLTALPNSAGVPGLLFASPTASLRYRAT